MPQKEQIFRSRVRSWASIRAGVPATVMGQRPQKAHGISADEPVIVQHCRYIGSIQDVFHWTSIVSEVLFIIIPNLKQS